MRGVSVALMFLLIPAAISCYGYLPGEWLTFGRHIPAEDGKPVEGVKVTFFRSDPPTINSDGARTVLTDENGWYSGDQWSLWQDKDFTFNPSHPAYIFSPTSYCFSGA